MFCKKCGASIPDGYKFCMNCGAKADVSQPNTIKKPLNKKILVSVLGIIVGLLIISGLAIKLSGPTEKDGYFANIPWGTDIETVQKKVDKYFKCESFVSGNSVKATVQDYNGMAGLNALVSLNCDENKTLDSVHVILIIDNGYTPDELFSILAEQYNKLYTQRVYNPGAGGMWQTPNSTICTFEELYAVTFEKLS